MRVGDLEAAEGIMAEMRAVRCAPNDYIFNSLLRGYCGQGGRSPDVSVTNVLLCFNNQVCAFQLHAQCYYGGYSLFIVVCSSQSKPCEPRRCTATSSTLLDVCPVCGAAAAYTRT